MAVPAEAVEFDARFEFDAPRFYDFEETSCGSPADKWFDTAPDGPGCKPPRADKAREPFKELQDNASNQPQQQGAAGKAGGLNEATSSKKAAAAAKAPTPPPAAAAAAKTPPPPPAAAVNARDDAENREAPAGQEAVADATKPNIVTSWAGLARKPTTAPDAAPGPSAGASKPTTSAPRRLSKEARRVSVTSSMVSAGGGGGEQQHQQAASSAAAPRVEPPITRSMARGGMALFSPVPEHKAKVGFGSPVGTRARTAQQQQQRFYTVQKAKGSSSAAAAAAASSRRPASASKLHQLLAPKVTKPTRSTKPLTLPDDFELQTSKRCHSRPPSASAAPEAAGAARSPFKPLAEKVRDFQYKTPPRFKTRPGSKAATSKKRSPITRAEAPQLLTSLRSRPRSAKTQQELEQEQLEQMKREQFRAKPVDSRVLSSSGQLGVPKVEKPRLTEPQPFHLRSDSRAKVRRSHEQPSMQVAAAAASGGGTFRAQPLNRSILDGPTFKPHRERPHTTVAVSPELTTKKRALTASMERGHDKPQTRSQAESRGRSSHGGAGSVPKLTHPQPFHLATEARGAAHAAELAAKTAADEARAKRLRRVTARPLPVSVDVPVVPPKPDSRPLTLPDPFELRSMARHEEYEDAHREQLQHEREAARRASEFKARPVAVAGPFVVHESEAPLTVPVEPHFATDARAVGRAEFDAHMAERMRHEEEERARQEELKRKAEEEAVREYRKKLRFSARPMPNFQHTGFHAQPSAKPLTTPRTPNFATNKKLGKRG